MVGTATIPDVASVSKLWPGSTIVCIGTGPSLTVEDVEFCRGRARAIAIKDAVRVAPWADVLYAAGSDNSKFWKRPENASVIASFPGLKFSVDEQAKSVSTVLQWGKMDGLSTDPTRLALGHNSGYQAINLAALLGASRIVLLGYDSQPDKDDRDHFYGQHWHGRAPNYHLMNAYFPTLVAPLRAIGVEVINASRVSALACFTKKTLSEALA